MFNRLHMYYYRIHKFILYNNYTVLIRVKINNIIGIQFFQRLAARNNNNKKKNIMYSQHTVRFDDVIITDGHI